MAKLRTFRVVNGRVLFKCHACQGKRMITVAPGVRTRSMHCAQCGEITRCMLNRRQLEREQQSGRILLLTGDGRQIEVDLVDISRDGVGIDVSTRDIMKIALGRDLLLKCPWNPQLLGQGRYVVKSIRGQRVGAERQK
ncbi:MAG: hypothetical protein ACD_75C00208G0002 [uncultured bacterium]|nr:MAG: hypothetical protein ACD_75C00208G0002 [uncultured bacterium]